MSEERTQAKHALKQAIRAAKKGDHREAERWSKTAERLTSVAERLAALPPEPDAYEEDEKMQAEIRARLARYADIDREIREWAYEAEVHAAYAERAEREGLPAPPALRPRPHSESFLERYAAHCFSDSNEPPAEEVTDEVS